MGSLDDFGDVAGDGGRRNTGGASFMSPAAPIRRPTSAGDGIDDFGLVFGWGGVAAVAGFVASHPHSTPCSCAV
jgi:hypothetical protein